MHRLLIRLPLLLLLLLASARGAEEPTEETPADSQSVDADAEASASVDVEQRIHELVLDLQDRDRGEAAVDDLVALGDPRVKWVFQHIMDRDLALLEGTPVWQVETGDGEIVYPLLAEVDAEGLPSGDPIPGVTADDTERYREIRRARSKIQDALAVIGLYFRDADERRQAAKDVGNKRIVEALPRLRELKADDPVAAVRRAAEESEALIVVAGADAEADEEVRAAAATRLGELKSLRARDRITERLRDQTLPSEYRSAYTGALAAIDRHQGVVDWSKRLFAGLSLGSILLLTALGLAVTFGLMGVINMAHGEMLMLGAVTSWACYEYIGSALPPEWFNWYYVIALPMSFLVAGLAGVLTELCIVRWLYKRPLDSLLATIGLSLVLIQAVRWWKGDNLGMTAPSWFSGGWEIMQDVILPYNRLFIIVLTAVCVFAVFALFRWTRFGLMLRATVQNREQAAASGVNTRLVDMVTFGIGSGLAGIAGCALVLLTNPTPEMGTTYIVKSFLVTVVGGVGSMLGVIFSAFGIGFLEKILEPMVIIEEPVRIFDSTWAQVAVLLAVVLFITRRPGGLFPDKGRLADRADGSAGAFIPRIPLRADLIMAAIFAGIAFLIVPFAYGVDLMSIGSVEKFGYIAAMAVCAIGLDLIWGYTGALSLCQFMFFALGGYAMGLYLVNHGPKDVNGIPECLAYVMSDVSNPTAPWFLSLFAPFGGAVVLGLILPGLLAALIGFATFRSRVRGVYFAILTQAITVGAWLVFQKNELKLGGTNGLTGFTEILGFDLEKNEDGGRFAQTDFWLYVASASALLIAIGIGRWIARSGLGRVMLATRDDETRLRFLGYRIWFWKTVVFVVAALFAAVGGMLYVPQKGIITPSSMAPMASIMVVIWVALGGRGTVWGAAIGAISVGLLYDGMTSFWPQGWLFVLGGLFILVPLLLPGGLTSVPLLVQRLVAPSHPLRPATLPEASAATKEGTV